MTAQVPFGPAYTATSGGGAPTGTAGGDLSGTYPNPGVAQVQGVAITAGAVTVAAQLANATTRSASATVVAGEETVFTGSTGSQTLTLPVTPQVSSINSFANLASVSVTLAPGAGNTMNLNGTVGNVTLAAGQTIQFVFVGTVWYAIEFGAFAGFTPPAADQSMNSHKITSLANGSGAQDGAAFGQIPTAGSTIPVPTVAGSAGSAATFMRSDAVPLREYWTPQDFGFAAWSYPCDFAASSGAAAMVSGTVYVSQVNLVATTTISKAYLDVQTIGSGLTASESFVGLFDPSNALIGFAHVNSGATELSTDFTSTGLKTITLAANGTGLTSLAPGKYRVGVFQVGTTPAQFKATISAAVILNGLLSAANSKYASADAGRTTSFASPLGTLTGYTSSFWVAIST